MSGRWLLVLAAAVANGQEVSVRGPVSGLIYNPAARAVQPIAGVPGGAYLGAAVLSEVDWAAIAPDGKKALIRRGGQVQLIGVGSRVLSIPSPEVAAWNSESTAVAVAAGGRLYVVREESTAELPWLDEPVLALGLDGSGRRAMVAAESGVYAVSEGGWPALLARVERPRAIAVRGGNVFVAGGEEVIEIGSTIRRLELDCGEMAGIAVSRDRLVAAGSKGVVIYDLRTRTVAGRVALDFEPEGVWAIPGGEHYLLKRGRPVYILSGPAVYFVPAGGEE